MSTSKFTLDGIGPELIRVLGDRTVILGKLTVQEAYYLVLACQLTVTHPLLGEWTKDIGVAIGRRLQELIRPQVSESFAEFIETGWHREFDQ